MGGGVLMGLWRVTLQEIVAEREMGWQYFHPEDFCHRCGNRNLHSWSVESDRFNIAMEALGLDSGAIVCPQCFVEGHEKATGLRTTWSLVPLDHFHPVEVS
jgi:hypothetical protein